MEIDGATRMTGISGRPLVRIVEGELRGVYEKTVYGKQYAAFKGIPYAKPPIGGLRFLDPVPVEPWSRAIDVSEFGGTCAQFDPTTRNFVGGDDCLYLNVYSPSPEESASPRRRPVMFWIHGGAFAYGSGDELLYGPDYLVERDVVLVTINYRLGVLGFLNLENEEISGNQGLKDQVLALNWVKRNISEFGGDPGNVTIFGGSAGGAAVHYLGLSPLAEGLYHKAISQSGVALNPWAHETRSHRGYARAMAAAAGLGREAWDSKTLAQLLRSVDARKLVEIERKIRGSREAGGTRLLFVPTVDADSRNPFFPLPRRIAVQSGVRVPYLIGNTSHEGIAFLPGVPKERALILGKHFDTVLNRNVTDFLNDKSMTATDLKEMYFGEKSLRASGAAAAADDDDRTARYNLMKMQTDLQFVCGIHDVAQIQSTITASPTYMYEFSYEPEISLIKVAFGVQDMPGACHGDEVAYLLYPKVMAKFGIPRPEPGSAEHSTMRRLTQMWSDFAKTGNPTPTATEAVPIVWNPIGSNGQGALRLLSIGRELRMKTVANVNERFVKKSKSNL